MLRHALHTLINPWRAVGRPAAARPVALVGAGPGDPDLLTVAALRLIAEADVIIHDRLVSDAILAKARRGARLVAVGKVPYGEGWSQEAINERIVAEARRGGSVVRLKGGDPVVFGRLDDEIDALEAAGIAYRIVPGVTAASAAAAAIGQSLTRRGRNGALRLLTGHDVNGFAEQDWRGLAAPGSTAAIYMGARAATFLRGRLLMHGARGDVAVTAVENASRPDERVIATTLMDLPAALAAAEPKGPVLILLGLAPRQAASALPGLRQAL